MTTIDNELFTFFEDFLIISSKNKAQFKELYNKCNSYLYNKLYSDINVQDSKGNTFLHYLSQHAIKDYDANIYLYDILQLGADPFVTNKKKEKALPEISDELIKRFQVTNYNNFYHHTVGFHTNFKQLLLNELLEHDVFYMPIDDIVQFLQKNGLSTQKNLIHMVFQSDIFQTLQYTNTKNIEDVIYEKLDYIFNLPRTPQENSFIVRLLSRSANTILGNIHTKEDKTYKGLLINFFENSVFEYDMQVVGFITSSIFHRRYETSKLSEQYLNCLIANLVSHHIDFKHTPIKSNANKTTLHHLMSDQDPVWKTYARYKLEFDLSHKLVQKNKPAKKYKI